MSGTKHSQFRLQHEREQKLRTLQALSGFSAEAVLLKERLAVLLDGASDGLRATFREEVGQAAAWQAGLELPDLAGVGMDTASGVLGEINARVQEAVAQGRRHVTALTVAFNERADGMGKELTRKFAETEALFLEHHRHLGLWYGELQTEAWAAQLRQIGQRIHEQHYADAGVELSRLRDELTRQAQFADQQEDKHQKRLYLLKALRGVCADMAFTEVTAPRFEREEDRGSAILFTVDTSNQGRIDFTLTLDGVSSESDMSRDSCFVNNFDQISAQLMEKFGVVTEFKMKSGEPPPQLKRKGEADVPHGQSAQAST